MAQAVEHAQGALPDLTAEPCLHLPLVLELVSQLESGEDHIGLGSNLAIAFQRADAAVYQFGQRLDVGFIRIAAYNVRLTGDADLDRALHCGPEQYRRDV